MKWFYNLKISVKIVIITIFFLVITAATNGVVTYYVFEKYSSNTYNGITNNALSALSSKIEDFKTNSIQTAIIIAADEAIIGDVLKKDNADLLKRLNKYQESTQSGMISFIDTKGNVAGDNKNNIAESKSFKTALTGSTAAYVEEGTDVKLSVRACAPIKDPNNNVIAIISVAYKLDDTKFIDELKADTGTELTIFAGDTRINTSIVQDGKRLVGTKVSETVSKKVLTEKQTYSGLADILGKKYTSIYKPIYNGDSKVVGILFSGVSVEEKETSIRQIFSLILIALAILIALSILSVIFITRKTIKKPIDNLISVAEQFADGNLDAKIEAHSKDEIGMLFNTFGLMSNKLNEFISNINLATDQVARGSKHIADSSINLSEGATEQAGAVEELTASMEEITAQAKANSSNANDASSLSELAKTKAVEGNSQVALMVNAMGEINKSSNDISRIIKVIDDISFQTNLLSLNAAIEAARAGEYGKGFAVVADEVRSLAASCANAAKETAEMIEESINNVKKGTLMAKNTDASLAQIVEVASKLAETVNSIAVASEEQLIGIQQVNQGIIQVSQVVQSNSATSEETAAASEELSGQAEMLKAQISAFKLREHIGTSF